MGVLLQKFGNALLIFIALRLRVWIRGSIVRRRFARDVKRVAEIQEALLLRILKKHSATEYGLAHGFAHVKSVSDFRSTLPVNSYEDLRPWFEKQEREQTPVITSEMPVLYTLTSGTTGKPKLLPVLKEALKANKKIQNFFLLHLFQARPKLADGKILTVVSPAIEGYTEHARIPYGATTGHMYASAPRVAQRKYVVPPAVLSVEDYDTRFRLILLLALLERDITYISTANPTTLLRLADLLNEEWDSLLASIASGNLEILATLSPAQSKAVQKKLVANPARAAELRELKAKNKHDRIRFQHIWPRIQAVGIWTCGSCGIFVDRLRPEFAASTLIRDVGYHSSEFRGSSPIFADTPAGAPSFREHFFEFVERSAWDQGEPRFLGLHELSVGDEYYVFVTTISGLFRYDMNDVIRVERFHEQLPLLRFLQKGKGVTSITGEKLYENQVISAVQAAEKELGLHSAFYLMHADAGESRYKLYYEPNRNDIAALVANLAAFAELLDRELGAINIEYATKRASRRLQPLQITPLCQGTFEAYKRFCLAQGQRESQFKIVALHYAHNFAFAIADYSIEGKESASVEPAALNQGASLHLHPRAT